MQPGKAAGIRHLMEIGDDGRGPTAQECLPVVFGKEMETFYVEMALDEAARDEAAGCIDDFMGGHVPVGEYPPIFYGHICLCAGLSDRIDEETVFDEEVGRRYHCSSCAFKDSGRSL